MKTRRLAVISVIALSAVNSVSTSFADLTVLGFEPQRHDRFYVGVDKDFIGDGFDWSGVARGYRASEGSHKRWATMISETHFLSANHFHPASGDELTFFQTNDATGVSWTAEVAGGVRIGDSDLWLGSLTVAPPAWVARYPLVARPETMNWPTYLPSDLFVFGQSDPEDLSTSQRLGKNAVERAYFMQTLGPPLGTYGAHGQVIGWTYDTDANGLGDDEAWTEGGDSGGPSFLATPAGLAIAGIHWGHGVDTATGSLAADIQSQLSPTERVVVVTDLRGDINGDYRVDGADFSILSGHWQQTSGVNYNDGDINQDGAVDGSDVAILSGVWQQVVTAPSDFNRDLLVNRADMKVIGDNWLQIVPLGTLGDASGDGFVDESDVDVLNANWNGGFSYFVPSQPHPADFYADGLIDGQDRYVLESHWQTSVTPFTNGDVNGDGFVDGSDASIMSGVWDPYGPADINEDYRINNEDLAVVIGNWGGSTMLGKVAGDLNSDGVVDSLDFHVISDWWGRNVRYMDDQAPLGSIPEPAALVSASMGLVAILGVTRRRKV